MQCPFAFVAALVGVALPAQNLGWRPLEAAPMPTAAVWDAAGRQLVLTGRSLGDPNSTNPSQRMWSVDAGGEHLRPLAMLDQPELHWLWADGEGGLLALASANSLVSGRYRVGRWLRGGWSWHEPGNAPVADASQAFAYDELRRRVVLYLGTSTGSSVHEWDGQQWLSAANGGPPARTQAAFAYDPVGRRCVLYGGRDASGALADCWAWDGFAWSLLHGNAPPGPRDGAGLGFDPHRGALVLYGGDQGAATWLLHGNAWTQLATVADAGVQLRPLLFADDQGLLLLGNLLTRAGFAYDPEQPLWRLTGDRWTLQHRFVLPTPRNNATYVYDRVRQEVVGFCGTDGSYAFRDTTVLYRDGRWRHVAPAHVPMRRWSNPMCWSPVDQRVLMFGGNTAQGPQADTWTWDGGDWQQLQPAHAPAPRWGFALSDEPGGSVVLFGGRDTSSWFADTWRWDGSDWQQLQPVHAPGARISALAALDPQTQRVLLFGGQTSTGLVTDTWLWDGVDWAAQASSPGNLNAQTSGLAVRPATNRLLLVGTSAHEWTGSSWVAAPPMSPSVPPQQWTRLAADLGRGELLLFLPPQVYVLPEASAASAARFGQSCAIGAAPALDLLDLPSLGATFALELVGRAAAAPAFVTLGLQEVNYPLGGGCTLLVGQRLATGPLLTDAAGLARMALTVPPAPALRGLQIAAQAAVFDPPHSTIGGATATAGLRLTIGD